MRFKGIISVFILGITMMSHAPAEACAWNLKWVRGLLGQSGTPEISVILSQVKGALDYIHTHPGSEQGVHEEVVKRTEELAQAHQQLISAITQLQQATWSAALAQQIFSEFADRILMSDEFVKSLRFVEARRKFDEEVWDDWDDNLQKLAQLIDKHLPEDTDEAKAARKVLGLWGEEAYLWSLRVSRQYVRMAGLGETENPVYEKWMGYRNQMRKSTGELLKRWGGLQKVQGSFSPLESTPPDLRSPGETIITSVTTAGRSLLDPDLEDEIDDASGRVDVSRKKDSGIRKPGAKRTPEQKFAFMSAAKRRAAQAPIPSFSKLVPKKKPDGNAPPPATP